MNNSVIIKCDKGGIHIIIDPDARLSDVIFQLEHKLTGTTSIYRNSKPINVTFDGKELTEDEERDILFVLSKIGLNVCHKDDKHKNSKQHNIKDNLSNILSDKDGLFYIGNLKNGQSIDAMCSIVIIGNVEKGASVYSNGNIVITGTLEGIAKSGCAGREDTFVYSLISGRNI